MLDKIKKFNLNHFKRSLLKKGVPPKNDSIKNLFLAEKKIDFLNQEDLKFFNDIKDYISTKHELPFVIENQEKQFLDRNKDNENKCIEYLIYRHKVRVLPQKLIKIDFPAYLLIEPASSCNLRCVMCFQIDKTFTKKPYMGVMDLDFFKKIIDEAKAGGTKAITLASRGEPTLNKHFSEMLAYTKGKFFEVKVNTNGTRLTEAHCHAILASEMTELVFSIDSEEKELYENIRVRGKFNDVINNIKMFNRIRKDFYPNSQTTTTASGVFFHDKQDIDSFTNFFEKIVDQVAAVKIENRWNTYANKVHPHIKSPCSYLWERMYIWFDGKTNVCDVDYKSYLSPGNLKDSSIKEVWNSKHYNKLRNDHKLGKRGARTPCDRCGLK